MKYYSKTEEESVRIHAAVREWTRSGLLDDKQGGVLAKETQPSLKRTNGFLRLVLFFFTVLIAGASVLLFFELLHITDNSASAAVCIVGAVICFSLAELIIGQYRAYRFGIEEAFAVVAVVLVVVAAGLLADRSDFQSTIGVVLAVGTIASLVLYIRFGFLYAGIAAMACAALVPFPVVHSEERARVLSGLILVSVFALTRRRHFVYGDDFPGDDYAAFETVAWAGLYAVVNLKLPFGHSTFGHFTTGWFYWTTYGLIWILPVVGLWMSIRGKHRLMIGVNIAIALATLATNKSYLGLKHQTWDPMLLGLLLMGSAIALRRWLASGPNDERRGFTSARILNKDAQLMSVLSTASAAFQPRPHAHEPSAPQPDFKGGRSGGGGATGEF